PAAASSRVAAASDDSLESTPTTASRPAAARATEATAPSSAWHSRHHEAKKFTITGFPRNADSDTGVPPPSGGRLNVGARAPGRRTGGGGDSSAADPPVDGCEGPRTTTKVTKAA